MTVETGEAIQRGVKFNKRLVSSVHQPLSTKELLSRLQSLTDELSGIHQDHVDLNSLDGIKRDLINTKLLKHSNIGVQAYTCCGLADILRLYAPDAPYTATELSIMFKAFFQQFRRLSDPENPYFQQQSYLLKRLAEVRSVILITDLPDSENLTETIFEIFYDLSSKNLPSKLEPLASDILSEVISECDTIPLKVLKLILNKFLSIDIENSALTTTGKSNISNPGFNFSVSICEANLDRMSRQVAQFFSEMLYDNKNAMALEGNDDSSSHKKNGLAEEARALETLKKIHTLSVKIWITIPELLSSVMGLINDELNASDEKIRILATDTVGKMIGSYSSERLMTSVNFIVAHKVTWLNWLKKSLDISPSVRCKWVDQLSSIVVSSSTSTSEISSELASGLTKCLLDTDERVRLTACLTISKIPFGKFTSKICTKSILSTLFQLMREKNSEIRNEVIKILGNIYYEYTEMDSNLVDFGNNNDKESQELEHMLKYDIANNMISLIYINDKNITSMVDLTLFEKLIPFDSNLSRRVEKLLCLYSTLDEKSKKSFHAINRRQQQISKVLLKFCLLGEEYARLKTKDRNIDSEISVDDTPEESYSDISEEHKILVQIDKIINWLCVSTPDGFNSYACFERLFKLRSMRFFYLIRTCVSPESDYNTVKNSMKELLNKLTNAKTIRLEKERSTVSTTDMVSNFKLLLYRSSMIFYNRSNILELIAHARSIDRPFFSIANELLDNIATTVPQALKVHHDHLVELVLESSEENLASHESKSEQLKTLYHLTKQFPDILPAVQDFKEKLARFAKSGSPEEAKYSIKILAFYSDHSEIFESILAVICPLKRDADSFITHLSTIAELLLVNPEVMEEDIGEITAFVIKDILLENTECSLLEDQDKGWLDDRDIPVHTTLYEKIISLRLFVNRVKSLGHGVKALPKESLSVAQPVFKLLNSIIGSGGEIASKKNGSKSLPRCYKLKLRLAAGSNLLKLAKVPVLHDLFTSNRVQKLVYLLQDENENVRLIFLTDLQKKLSQESISERFLPLIFFMAYEPNTGLKSEVSSWIKSMYKRREAQHSMAFEKSLARVIHMMSHNDEFIDLLKKQGSEKESEASTYKAYLHALECILFYLHNIATAENCSLLYYMASRVKQYRDATIDQDLYNQQPFPDEVVNLYRAAELAQFMIRELSVAKNWNLQTWPGKVQLPTDLFTTMMNTKEAHDVVTAVYISDKIQLQLKTMCKSRFTGSGKRRKADNSIPSGPSKRTRPGSHTKRNGGSKKKSKVQHSEFTSIRKSGRTKASINYNENEGGDVSSSESEDSEFY